MAALDYEIWASNDYSAAPSAENTWETILTPFSAGTLNANADYMVIAFGPHGVISTSNVAGFRYQLGGTTINREFYTEGAKGWSGYGVPFCMMERLTTPSSPGALTLDGINLDSTQGLNVRDGQLLCIDLGSLTSDDFRYSSFDTLQSGLGTSFISYTNVILPQGTDDWLVFYNADWDANNTSDEFQIRLYDGFTEVADSLMQDESEDTREQHMFGRYLAVAESNSGPTTLSVQCKSSSANLDLVRVQIFALRLNAFTQHAVIKDSTDTNLPNSAVYTPYSDLAGPVISENATYLNFVGATQSLTQCSGTRTRSNWQQKIGSGGTYTNPTNSAIDGSGIVVQLATNDPNGIQPIGTWVYEYGHTISDQPYFRFQVTEGDDTTVSNDITFGQVVLFSTNLAAVSGGGVSPSGIASAEAFGSPTITPGNVDVAPGGVASAEAFGTPTLGGEVTVLPSGIATAEAHGDHTVTPGGVNVVPGGIVSAEAFGTHIVAPGAVSLAVNGIPSAEAFGNPTILPTYGITVTGIPSEEAFGAHTVVPGVVIVTPPGIPSEEAFGTAALAQGEAQIFVNGIPSGEAFGATTVVPGEAQILVNGIPSEEAFGITTLVPGEAQILVNGIPSEEAFGTTVLSSLFNVYPLAIQSEEAFGLPTIVPGEVTILPGSIASEEAFGNPIASTGGTIIVPPSILTGEAFGITAIETGAVSVLPTGISSGEVFGVPTLVPGAATLLPASIVSAEAFGNALIESGASIVEVQAIASGEAFGTPVLALGGAAVAPTGIISQELFGTPLVAPGGVTLSPSGIATAEAFGVPSFLVGGVNVTPSGIVTQEAFGTPILTLGGVALSPLAIASQEIFGTPTLSTAIAVLPPSIGSQEAFGTPSLETGGTFVFPVAIPSEEIFGFIQVTGGAQPDQSFVRFVSMSQPMFRNVFNELLAKDPFAG